MAKSEMKVQSLDGSPPRAGISLIAALTYCGVALLALGSLTSVQAQETYPARTIRLVVGFGAGGPTDIPARFIADKLSGLLDKRVVVENKAGAGGMLATREILAQDADGYNLLLCTHFESINTVLYKNPLYKLSDLQPISLIAKYYYGFAISNSIPPEDFKQFLQYAKSHPGEVSYGTIGAGSAQEIFARQLERIADIKMVKIPFRSSPQVMQELIAGRLSMFISPTLAVLPQYHAKQLKVLAVTSPARLDTSPEIPTFKELGLDFVRFGWLGVCAPRGTPQPVVDLLNRNIVAIVATPEYRKLIESAGSFAISSTPEDLGKMLTQTVDDVASTIREFGMQQE
jgi:tripartite-type tricarboxylate transporter receptor subunit TctC